MEVYKFNDKDIIINKTWAGQMAAYMCDIPFRNHVSNGAIFEQDMIKDMLEPYIKRSKYIYDVGAHVGNHTMAYLYFNPDAHIHAFEPQTDVYNLLELNTKTLNPEKTKNVTLYNMALGNEHAIKEMQANTFGCSAHIGVGGQSIRVTCLDYLNPIGCDYIKIDVEGYEPFVIEGAKKTIQKFRPIICFEDNGSSKTNNITELSTHDLLKELEYVIHPLEYSNYIAFPIVKSNFRNCSGPT
jgi:hypothetical protein